MDRLQPEQLAALYQAVRPDPRPWGYLWRPQIGNAWLAKLEPMLHPEDYQALEDLDEQRIKAMRENRKLESRWRKDCRRRVAELVAEVRSEREPDDWRLVRSRGGEITEADLEAARAYPMEDLVGDVQHGKILCPFHDDSNPSMMVYEDGVKCFVCGAYCDQIDWLIKVESLSFRDAVRKLAGGM